MEKLTKVLAVFTVLAAAFIVWQELSHRERTAEAVERANVVADSFTAIIDSQAGTIEERGRQSLDDAEVMDSLRAANSGLAEKLEDADVLALSHARARAMLRDSIRKLESRPTVDPETGFLRYPIRWTRAADPDNFFEVEGGMTVIEDRGFVDLDLKIGLALDVVVSRAPDLSLRCDAATGFPGVVTLTSLSCVDNLGDPLTPTPTSFALRMLEPPSLLTGLIGGVVGLVAGVALSQ
jgi:hypothetical protein